MYCSYSTLYSNKAMNWLDKKKLDLTHKVQCRVVLSRVTVQIEQYSVAVSSVTVDTEQFSVVAIFSFSFSK